MASIFVVSIPLTLLELSLTPKFKQGRASAPTCRELVAAHPLSLNFPLVQICHWSAFLNVSGRLTGLPSELHETGWILFPRKSWFCLLSLALRPSSANSISSSTSSNHSGYTPEPPLPPVGGDLASRLSSDEGEMDGADESEKLLDCHFSTHHPRPLAVGLLLFPSRRCFPLCFAVSRWLCPTMASFLRRGLRDSVLRKGFPWGWMITLEIPSENHRRKGKGSQLILIL